VLSGSWVNGRQKGSREVGGQESSRRMGVKELAFADVHKLYDRWNMNQIADSKLFIPASLFRAEGNEVEFGVGRCDDGAEGQAQRT